ncbi:MAG: hypothetical protein O7I93_04160 [Gemmatimonadetes bacterium]|nr:hypothetical protein [Gemmatimonadota bacterium]
MSDTFARQETALSDMLHAAVRGPRRNGLFAVWLVLRACGDLLPPNRVSDRGHRQRIANIAGRLHSLSLPAPLRKALAGSIHQLSEGTAAAASIALRQLVAPVGETLGPASADAIARAARIAGEVRRRTGWMETAGG